MKPLQLNHWYVQDNKLSISLLRYYVSIEMVMDGTVSFLMKVYDGEGECLVFHFSTLEEAVTFTEDVISNKRLMGDITNSYQKIKKNR